MKKTLWRVLALCLSLIMLVSCMAACSKDGDDSEENIYSSAVEEGSEEELTAVREDLIKYTELEGFGEVDKMELYENGARTTSSEYVQVKDNKKIYYSGDTKRVVNYTDGYIMDMPADWKPDYTMSSLRVRYDTDEVSLIISREDDAVPRYNNDINKYFSTLYFYLKDPAFQANNKVTVIEDIPAKDIGDDWKMMVYRVKLEDCAEGIKCYYTYVDFYNHINETIHMMFKSVDDRDFSSVYETVKPIYKKGAAVDTRLYPNQDNPNWAPETKEHMTKLREQEHVDWGLFSYKLQTTGIKVNIPLLEKKMDYEFPVISEYVHYGSKENLVAETKVGQFPSEFANKMKDDGRMMQISYQYTLCNNMDLTFFSPSLDIYRRTEESTKILTDFATAAAEHGQPFYFRLNNEMNTDWTSYCALANMLDPDIFVDTWIRLYDIFTETGANQYAIWIFNGFDNSYPPFKWADYKCYMPNSEYVDMLGLTGYNFVTEEDTTTWRTFESIYDDIYAAYEPNFGDWLWIISEFGCESSTNPEQSKSQWITEMFDTLDAGKYPQLKVAIWFNCNDYNDQGQVTNELAISDDEDIQAFKDGLAKTQP